MAVKILQTSKRIYVREGNVVTIHHTEGKGTGSDVIICPNVAAAKKILGDISSLKGGSKK